MALRYMHSGTLHYGYLALFCPGETYTFLYENPVNNNNNFIHPLIFYKKKNWQWV